MTREEASYLDNLKRLDEILPDTELLTRKDMCTITGLSRHGIARNFPFSGKYISKANFARILAGTGNSDDSASG